jgi:putative phage-type endonuclease
VTVNIEPDLQTQIRQTDTLLTERYLARSGGRLACPHPAHRFAQVKDSPARVILPECAGRAPWLAARREGIGGSEVAALVGISDYETPWSIYNKKVATEPDVELTGAPIEWGHRLEDVVAQKVAEDIGMASRFGGGLWANPEKSFLRVTPDRFATKPRAGRAQAPNECKTAGDDEHWESGTITPKSLAGVSTGSAPLAYQAQAQWQMGIIGLPVCYLGCLVLGRERQFFTVEIHFDKDWFAELAAEAERFWTQNVLPREVPMHDLRHPKTEELLKTLHPKVVKPSIDLPEDTEEWLADYLKAKAAFEKAETDLDTVKNYFRMMTGDAGAGYLPWPGKPEGLKITSYPEVSSSGIDVEKLKTEYPEVAEKCTRRSSYRRLTITVPKALKAKLAAESATPE